MADTPLAPVVRHIRKLARRSLADERTDACLLEQFLRRGDQDAFAALVGRHGPLVWRVCRRVLRHVHQAEEAYQATFVVLARRAAKVRNPAALASWLYAVAYRIARQARADIVRQQSRHREPMVVPSVDPAREAACRELEGIVVEEVHSLPEKYRLPILLCYWEGLTNEEAARQLAWPAGTVKTRLLRARQLLHQRLTRRGVRLPLGVLATLLATGGGDAAVPPVLATASAGALAAQAIRAMACVKAKAVIALLLVAGAVAAGVVALTSPQPLARPIGENPKAEQPQAPVEPVNLRTDRYGDPLPPGAVARFGTMRFRHGSYICGLSLSPDGRTLATVGGHGYVRLWEVATGKELRSLHREKPWTTSYMVAFSPDARTIATSGQAGVSLWQADNGRWLRDLEASNVYSLAFSPDGKTLAAMDSHLGPSLWDVASGKQIAQLRERLAGRSDRRRGHHALAFSPDGRRLASTYEDSAILWDVAARREVRRLENSGKQVHTVAFAPDGKRLASGGEGGTIRFWDAATGRELCQFKGHEATVTSLVFSADGKTLFSGSGYSSVFGLPGEERRALRVWDVATGKEREPLGEHTTGVLALVLTTDGARIISAEGGSVRLWDIGTRKEVRRLGGHQHWIGSVAFAPDGKHLATAGGDRTIRLWDAATGRELQTLDAAAEVDSVAFSPDGRLIASGSRDGVIRLWDASSGREVRHIRAHERELWVAFSPDGIRLASASRDATAALWDVATGTELRRFKGDYDGFLCVAFSPDGQRIAAGEITEKARLAVQPNEPTPLVRVWDVTTGKQVHALQGHKHIGVHGVAFSPDGMVLASAGWDATTRLWDLATGRALGQIPAGEESVAFSPDGRMLATGGFDDMVRLWEVATRKERLHFAGHRAFIHGLAFAPDGRTLVSGSMDSTALLWDVRGLGRPARLTDRETCWQALADADAAKAYRAMTALTAVPEQSVPFLRERIHAVRPADPQVLARLLAELDSERFEVREKAAKQMEAIGELATPALRKALAAKPPLEVRRRIEQLLVNIKPAHSPEQLRALRAVEVLEEIGTPDARKVLQTLANGAPEARLTRETKASLERLARRRISRN